MKRYCYNCINDCEKLRGNLCVIAVAPYAGAWIEICGCLVSEIARHRRSLRGSVD